ncbi:18579_t:CDS:2, partial [Racocetra fulgida]
HGYSINITQYSSLSTSQNIHSSNFLSASSSNTTLPIVECISFDEELVIPSSQNKGKNKRPLIEDDDSSNKLWSNSNVKLLLAYLSENFDSYRKNKEKFYASTALHLGGKSSVQHYGTNVNNNKEKIQRKKKKLNDDNLSYIESVAIISESKKISAESRKKWHNEHSEMEREKLKFEKKYKSRDIELQEAEYKLRKKEVEARIKIDNDKLEFEKQMKMNFELKLKELETKLKELEMKHRD